MLDLSWATSPAPSPTLVDFGGLLPVPQKLPPKKSSLLSVFLWMTGIVRRHPFLSAVILYAGLTGLVARFAKSSYNRDRQQPDAKFEYEGNGVGFSPVSLVELELTPHIVGSNPRIRSSARYCQQNAVNRMDALRVWGTCTTPLRGSR